MIVRQCAWCKELLGTIDDGKDEVSSSYTHGICEPCFREWIKRARKEKESDAMPKLQTRHNVH